jgi:phenylacetate-CoA ligase
MQASKLQRLLCHVQEEVPFYAARTRARHTYRPGDDPLDFLRELPVIGKSDMRCNPTSFRRTGIRARVFDRHTGGSTGAPFAYVTDVPALSGQWAAVFRAWEWGGYHLGDVMVTVGGASVVSAGKAGLKTRIYNLLRNNHPMAVGTLNEHDLDTMLSEMAMIRPVLLYGYPSVLYLLATRAAACGRLDIRPRTIVTTSEMLFSGQRRVIEEAFAAPVFDQYGCNEVNLVSAECERHDGWHYAMESTLVEILDDDGLPVPTGRSGRIVGTSLDNLEMPFLRYDTGDVGTLDTEPCACGRGLVRIRELQGRSRDLIRTPDGRYVHGVAFNDLMLEYPAVDRYQAVQADARHLCVIVAGDINRLTTCERSLRQRLGELTGLEVIIDINGEFEITVGRKARVIISHLDPWEGG